jgi:lysophospholipase L1-like esterase
MNKKILKKLIIIFVIFIAFIILAKIIDLLLMKITGLGKPIIYKYSPIYGYEHNPNQIINRKNNILKINESGMRSNHDWKDNIANYKILFIGDSVTYGGSIISNSDTFSEKTCKKFETTNKKKYICGNLAVNGYGIESITRRIKYKKINDEDIIVIVLIANDIERGIVHLGAQPYWDNEINNLYPALTELSMFYIDKFRIKLRYKNINSELDTYSKKNDPDKEILLQYYNDIINELKLTLINNNKKFIIFYSPEKEEFAKKNKYLEIKKIVEKNFPGYIDLSKYTESIQDKIYYDNIHLNKLGHEIYTDIIYKILGDYLKKI